MIQNFSNNNNSVVYRIYIGSDITTSDFSGNNCITQTAREHQELPTVNTPFLSFLLLSVYYLICLLSLCTFTLFSCIDIFCIHFLLFILIYCVSINMAFSGENIKGSCQNSKKKKGKCTFYIRF